MWDPQVFVWSVKFSPRFHCQDVVIFNAKFELLWSVQLIYLRLDVRLKYPLRSFGKRRIAYWCLFYHFGIDSNLLKFHYFPFISNPFFFFYFFWVSCPEGVVILQFFLILFFLKELLWILLMRLYLFACEIYLWVLMDSIPLAFKVQLPLSSLPARKFKEKNPKSVNRS